MCKNTSQTLISIPDKKPRKLGIEEIFSTWNDSYNKYTANIILNGKAECFPYKTGNKARMNTFMTTIQYCTVILVSTMRKEKKDIQIEKEETKLSLLTDNMIFYQ